MAKIAKKTAKKNSETKTPDVAELTKTESSDAKASKPVKAAKPKKSAAKKASKKVSTKKARAKKTVAKKPTAKRSYKRRVTKKSAGPSGTAKSLLASMKSARQDRGLSQGAVAKSLGVSLGTVAGWEGGRSTPRAGAVKKIQKFVDGSAGVPRGGAPVAKTSRGPKLSGGRKLTAGASSSVLAAAITDAVLASSVMTRLAALLDAVSGGSKLTLLELSGLMESAKAVF